MGGHECTAFWFLHFSAFLRFFLNLQRKLMLQCAAGGCRPNALHRCSQLRDCARPFDEVRICPISGLSTLQAEQRKATQSDEGWLMLAALLRVPLRCRERAPLPSPKRRPEERCAAKFLAAVSPTPSRPPPPPPPPTVPEGKWGSYELLHRAFQRPKMGARSRELL